MKLFIWILIVLVLAAVMVITVPSIDAYVCVHEYVKSEDCAQGICIKCNEVIHYSGPNHSYRIADCSNRFCADCGKMEQGDFHTYNKIVCTDKMCCAVCKSEKMNPSGVHHANLVTRRDGCTEVVSCADCDKWILEKNAHEWVTENCEEGFMCQNCGCDIYPFSPTHSYEYSNIGFFYSVASCRKCSKIKFGWPSFGAVCVLVGLLMSIAAFVFIFVNRKRIRVQEGRFFCTITPDSHLRKGDTE